MGGEFAAWGRVFVAEDDPQSGAIGFVIAGADGPGELGELEARAAQEFGEDAAGVVNEVAKTLGNKNGVYVAGSGLLELMEIVIGQRLFEWDFDCGGRLVLVGSDADGHGGYGFTPRGLFRIGAAEENGQGAVELLGENDAGKFMGEGHRAEGQCVVGAVAELIREAVGVAAEENDFAGATVAEFAEPPSESVRIEVLSASVEKDHSGGAIGVEFLEGGRSITDLCDFNGTPAADAFYIVVEDGAEAGNRAGGTRRSGAHIFRKILGIEEVTPGSRCAAAGTRENHRTLESVAEFANVAGPGVSRQHTARRIAQLRTGAGMDGANRHEKMIGERQDIGAALAQRWNRESENVEPEIKILAEAAGLHGGGKIDVGEGDQASFDAQGFRATEAFKRALLQNAQELALRSGRECRDLIEKDGAVAAELETAELALHRAGKGTALVAE